MYKTVIIITLVVSAFAAGIALSKPKTCVADCGGQILSVKAPEFLEAAQNQTVTVIDVRTPEEYAQGHLPKAINADFNNQTQFQAYLNSLNKNATYLIYCRTGNRSGQTMKQMEEKGFKNLINLSGGIVAWQSAGLPLTY